MTTKHELPSGGWVEIREASELRAKDRKAMLRKVPDPVDGHKMGFVVDSADLIAAAVIVAWDLPYAPDAPLPSVRLDTLDELTMADDQAMQAAIAPLVELFMPKAPTDPSDYNHKDGTPNVDSPTEPSSA